MSKNKPITREDARYYAFDQAVKLQEQLNQHTQTLRSTDDYRIAYELSLTIDILKDDTVIDEIHWELKRGKRSLSDDLGNYLYNMLVYTQDTEESYIDLYRRSVQ